jgi:cation diffusion facilitator CzcD-associated flavoprotein CzcO
MRDRVSSMTRNRRPENCFSRRDLIKATAAGAGAAAWMGASAEQAEARPGHWDEEADVVVVGAGATGLPAAIEAIEAGATVMMIEGRLFTRQPGSSGFWASQFRESAAARAGLAVMAVTARLGPARNLKSQCAAFLVPNTDRFFHLAKEDFSVADISRRCCLQDRIDSGIHQVLRQHQLQLNFRQKIDGIFPASVDLRVTFLTSVAAHIGDGHSADAQFGQDFLDSLEPGRLDDRF